MTTTIVDSMIEPIRVGAFRELSLGLPDDPSLLHAALNEKSSLNVVSYLDSGTSLVAGGIARDVLRPENTGIGVQGVRTDGVYIWPAELGSYVRQHGVPLPRDFLEHVGSRTQPDPVPGTRVEEITGWMLRGSMP